MAQLLPPNQHCDVQTRAIHGGRVQLAEQLGVAEPRDVGETNLKDARALGDHLGGSVRRDDEGGMRMGWDEGRDT